MKKNYTVIISLLCIVCGCGKQDNDVVSFREASSLDALIEHSSSVELIPLQTDGEHLLGSPVLLNVFDGGFVLSDIINNNIYRYSTDGSFLNRIGYEGRGPGEYTNVKSVQIIDQDVLVFSSQKCVHYSNTGDYLSEVASQEFGEQSILYNDGFVTYWGYGVGKGYRIGLLDSQGAFVKGQLPSEERVIHFSPNTPIFSQSGKDILITDSYSPTVLRYSDESLSPAVTVDFGKYSIPKSYFCHQNAFEAQEELLRREFALVCSYWESGKLRIIDTIVQKKGGPEKYYAINNGNGWSWFSGGDLGKDPFAGTLKCVKDNDVYFLLDAALMPQISPEILPLLKNPEVLNGIKPMDNYIIAVFHVKVD